MKKFINIFMLLLCVCIVSCDDSNDNVAGLEIVKRVQLLQLPEEI